MTTKWTEVTVQQYIENKVEEGLSLEYKSADALQKTDGKRKEITKDVSAMANSAGGIIIYGIAEFSEQDKRHLPEKIDPINRLAYSKEWLEQVISNIRPRIEGIIIHPVNINDTTYGVIYVVEIPQSTTAHQATDHRYYKRFNFESVPMEDYEVRDTMNRSVVPDISVEFGYKPLRTSNTKHNYMLKAVVKNIANTVVQNYKVVFTFPNFIGNIEHLVQYLNHVRLSKDDENNIVVHYHSRTVLFPQDEIDIGEELAWRYEIDDEVYRKIRDYARENEELHIHWKIFADNMPKKEGKTPFRKLNCY